MQFTSAAYNICIGNINYAVAVDATIWFCYVIHAGSLSYSFSFLLLFDQQVVAPTINNPACQEQLVDAAKVVAKSVDSVVGTAQGACPDDHALQGLKEAATSVTKALNDLLQHIKRGVPIEKHVSKSVIT